MESLRHIPVSSGDDDIRVIPANKNWVAIKREKVSTNERVGIALTGN